MLFRNKIRETKDVRLIIRAEYDAFFGWFRQEH